MRTWEDYKKDAKEANDVVRQDIEEMEVLAVIVTAIINKRNELGYTQRELAVICGLPQSSVARIEACVVKPNIVNGCTSLTTAPILPATTLTNGCYAHMFQGCTGLTTAPVLPATTLADGCYQYMFFGCSNLRSVACLATTNISLVNCYYWLNGVASTGTFNQAPGATWTTGIYGIPSGWTVQNPQNMPLTFEAKVANSKVRFTISPVADLHDVEYSTDGGSSWQTYTNKTDINLPNVGDKVQFRGIASSCCGCKFSSTAGEVYVYGNVMSLLYGSDFADKTDFPSGSEFTFSSMFQGFSTLYSHPSLALLLPATTLPIFCYIYTFYGCTNLSSVTCWATDITATGCLDDWFSGAGTNATSPTLHVKSTMASANWNATGWTIAADQ